MTQRAKLFAKLLAEEATKVASPTAHHTALLQDIRDATFANGAILNALAMHVVAIHGPNPQEAILIGVQLGALAGMREPMESLAFDIDHDSGGITNAL